MLFLRASVILLTSALCASAQIPIREQLRSVLDVLHQYRGDESSLVSRSVATAEIDNLVVNTMSLELGTPPQKFDVIVDTGSPDAWFFGKTGCSNCGPQRFEETKSSTYKKVSDKPINTKYLDGTSASGFSAMDTLIVDNKTVTDFEFMYVNTYVQHGDTSRSASYPAMLGVSLPVNASSPAELRKVTQLGSSVTAQLSKAGIYSFGLRGSVNGAPGSINFGGIDETQFQTPMKWLNIGTGSGTPKDISAIPLWTAPLNTVAVDGRNVPIYLATNTTLILDTGTTMTMLPSSIVMAIGSALGGKLLPAPNGVSASSFPIVYQFQCAQAATLPTLSLTFNGVTLDIPATVYIQDSFVNSVSGCVMGIVGLPGNGQLGLVGMNLLRNFYTSWHWDTGRIGFAQLPPPAVPQGKKESGASLSSSATVQATLLALLASAIAIYTF
ncbi:aspartic peptidase domain-containing protein [Powellomyces hirtus]|nr:aspartic peptidase domain-containing protein [Powellomyces hirtus]